MSDPNSMKLAAAIPYKVTSQPLDAYFNVAGVLNGIVCDGWSLAIRNNCGAALGTGCELHLDIPDGCIPRERNTHRVDVFVIDFYPVKINESA